MAIARTINIPKAKVLANAILTAMASTITKANTKGMTAIKIQSYG